MITHDLEDVKNVDIRIIWAGEGLPRLDAKGKPASNPFRAEKEVSLQVGGQHNIVTDYGDPDVRWSTIDLIMRTRQCDISDAIRIIRSDYMGQHMPTSNYSDPDQTYDYHDEHGNLLYQVCRWWAPKRFMQRRPDGRGWAYKLGDTRRVLYRLPEVIAGVAAGKTIYVCEGEKDADTLTSLGLVATTAAGGAIRRGDKWLDSYNETLRGANVVLLEDNDDPGAAHVRLVAGRLYGIAKTIKGVLLPNLPEKGDVSDYFARGGTLVEFQSIVDSTPLWRVCDPDLPDRRATDVVEAIMSDHAPQYHATDLGNAQRLADNFRDKIRYCDTHKSWYIYTGVRWAEDRILYMQRAAERVIHELHAEADLCQTPAEKRALKQHATKSESNHAINAMINLAAGKEGLQVLPEQLDNNRMLFGLDNGVFDLQTMTFRASRPEDYITKGSPVSYDPDARCPRWEQFLDDIFQGDADLISFVQRLAGYCLTGLTGEQKMVIFHGCGQNGKSTLVETLQRVMGDYARMIDTSLLMINRNESHPTGLADLQGIRMAFAVETGDGKVLAENLVKSITGGDTIKARRMRQDFFEFAPTHKIILSTNHKPLINGTDLGIWRRILLIPFAFTVPDDQKIDDYSMILAAEEGPGIINWCIEGYREYLEVGLNEPDVVKAATSEYRSDMDVLGDFIASCCVEAKVAQVRSRDLIAKYEEWCAQNGETPMKGRALADKLKQRGYQPYRANQDRMWRYIGLANQGDWREDS